MNVLSRPQEPHLERALRAASETRFLAVDAGIRHAAAEVFAAQFGSRRGVIVADQRTFAAAGGDVLESFRKAGHDVADPFVFGPHVYAEYACVEELQVALEAVDAIPVAVGSGTINDLVKLVAHRLGRPYLVVATAASMDGYTAYGSSITYRGSKQTFDCPGPLAVLTRQGEWGEFTDDALVDEVVGWGGGEGENEIGTFFKIAADNSARVLLAFLAAWK